MEITLTELQRECRLDFVKAERVLKFLEKKKNEEYTPSEIEKIFENESDPSIEEIENATELFEKRRANRAETLVMPKIAEENTKFTFTGKSGATIIEIICDVLRTKNKLLTDNNIVNELRKINGGYFENEFAQENLTSYIKSNFTV